MQKKKTLRNENSKKYAAEVWNDVLNQALETRLRKEITGEFYFMSNSLFFLAYDLNFRLKKRLLQTIINITSIININKSFL